jgi:cytochrome P450
VHPDAVTLDPSRPPSLLMRRDSPLAPPEQLAQYRERDALTKVGCPRGMNAWLVTRHATVREMLSDATTFSSTDAPFAHLYEDWPLESRPGPSDLIRLDNQSHARLRRRLVGEFTVRRMRTLEPAIQDMVDRCIDAIAAAKAPVDFNAWFSVPLATLSIAHVLGVPELEFAEFEHHVARINDLTVGREARAGAHRAIRRYMTGRVRAERRDAGDNLLGRLVAENDPADPLTERDLVDLGTGLLNGGAETTAGMVSLSVLALLSRPGLSDALRQDIDLVGTAVEELLRYLAVVQYGIVRRATKDTELGGTRVRAGEHVVASLPAANHDPDLLDRPDVLDVRRRRVRHVAFGHGAHQCIGQNLARAQLRITLMSIVTRIPTLRLAVPIGEISFRHEMSVYGVHALPVSWEAVLPRSAD